MIIIRSIFTQEVIDSMICNEELKGTPEMDKMLDDAGFYMTSHDCDLIRDQDKLMGRVLNAVNFELVDEGDFVADEEITITGD
jgi:hypothetical protein